MRRRLWRTIWRRGVLRTSCMRICRAPRCYERVDLDAAVRRERKVPSGMRSYGALPIAINTAETGIEEFAAVCGGEREPTSESRSLPSSCRYRRALSTSLDVCHLI